MSHVQFLKSYRQRKGANIALSKTCKFIAGEKPYGDNPWCGAVAVEGSSYCEHHHALTHEPIDTRQTSQFTKHAEFVARITR